MYENFCVRTHGPLISRIAAVVAVSRFSCHTTPVQHYTSPQSYRYHIVRFTINYSRWKMILHVAKMRRGLATIPRAPRVSARKGVKCTFDMALVRRTTEPSPMAFTVTCTSDPSWGPLESSRSQLSPSWLPRPPHSKPHSVRVESCHVICDSPGGGTHTPSSDSRRSPRVRCLLACFTLLLQLPCWNLPRK